MRYLEFFGFQKEPFRKDLTVKELLSLPGMNAAMERIHYSLEVGGVCVITGDIGLGKSTALRWSTSSLHPSAVVVLQVVGTSGSISELYRSIAWELGLNPSSVSRARIMKDIKDTLFEIVHTKKQKVLLCIDESNLLRTEVYAELHTLCQLDYDSRNLFAIILCGQNTIIDMLHHRSSGALASRVIARSHLEPLSADTTKEYVNHHITVAKLKHNPFDEPALTAIYQGSGGVPRRINGLARGGLMAAATTNKQVVTAEHIRIAASELI